MHLRKVVENILSNWVNLVVTIAIAFVVSPVVVRTLGKELYGVWTLVVSVTGYFTVLDFGVNTAIVRYISSSAARNDHDRARAVYSTSMTIFGITASVLMLFSLVFGYFFQDLFELHHIPRSYLFAVFMVSALGLAGGLVCSVFLGALTGLQEFKFINGNSLLINVVKNVALVLMLGSGYSLLSVAVLQLVGTGARALCQYVFLRRKYRHLVFDRSSVNRDTMRLIYNYSVYSFVIAVALKLLFYTDSVVIGARIGVAQVAFYAIPSSLLDYMEKFVWSMISVLVPMISANEATGEGGANERLYITGTRYTLLISMPVVIALYFYGGDFITLWMGPEFGERSLWVLRLLLIGFGFSFSQLIAHGILKGISKHKVLAYILALEALANLGMSVALAGPYGIEGVAVGTLVPLVAASACIIRYTCRLLGIGIRSYLARAYGGAVLGTAPALLFVAFNPYRITGYFSLLAACAAVAAVFLAAALPVSLERGHKELLLRKLFGRTAASRG